MLIQTPEQIKKFIRTDGRSFPVYECLINANWEQCGLAKIAVARKLNNGHIMWAGYLVDIFCLGVKDTHYEFNVDNAQWQEVKHRLKTSMLGAINIEDIDYSLAHGIIYGAVSFAEKFGFKPHKDFSVTKFILKATTEQSAIREITFGKNGKPHIIVHDYDALTIAGLEHLKANFKEGDFSISSETGFISKVLRKIQKYVLSNDQKEFF